MSVFERLVVPARQKIHWRKSQVEKSLKLIPSLLAGLWESYRASNPFDWRCFRYWGRARQVERIRHNYEGDDLWLWETTKSNGIRKKILSRAVYFLIKITCLKIEVAGIHSKKYQVRRRQFNLFNQVKQTAHWSHETGIILQSKNKWLQTNYSEGRSQVNKSS